ncbi:MAG: hypothetical protein ACO1OB_15235 [Archangium sp.]
MKRLAFLLLLISACKTKEVERHGKLIIVRESLNGWLDWEHNDHQFHLECAGLFGKRVATNLRGHAGSTNYVSWTDGASVRLADTTDCSVSTLFTDPRLNVDAVEWSASGKYGFKQVLGHLGGENWGTIDGTKGASASFIIHATKPPTMESLDGRAWLTVGSSLYGMPCWSPLSDVLFLARHVETDGGERAYEVATWTPDAGLHVFDFKSPPGEIFPNEHGWNGATPWLRTPQGIVELR